MKRIVSVLAVMALMAALLAASAMPAFAKVNIKEDTFECDENTLQCSGTFTRVGGSKDSEFNGKRTTDGTINFNPDDENFGDISLNTNDQGGGKDTGGGNCTSTLDGNLLDPELPSPTKEGNGSRCN